MFIVEDMYSKILYGLLSCLLQFYFSYLWRQPEPLPVQFYQEHGKTGSAEGFEACPTKGFFLWYRVVDKGSSFYACKSVESGQHLSLISFSILLSPNVTRFS